jgi:DNA-binding PadR family transcriptional regulator
LVSDAIVFGAKQDQLMDSWMEEDKNLYTLTPTGKKRYQEELLIFQQETANKLTNLILNLRKKT